MGDCLGHLPFPVCKWFGESEWMSECRRCRKMSNGDSWNPILRADSQDLFTTIVKWTKIEEGENNRVIFTRCHSDPCCEGENPVQGESCVELKKCSNSSTNLCITSRVELLDICRCGDQPERDMLLPPGLQFCKCRSVKEIDMSDYGEEESDQDYSTSTPCRGMESTEVLQKMSSTSLKLSGGDDGSLKRDEKTGNDAAILVLESPKLLEKSESSSFLLGSFF